MSSNISLTTSNNIISSSILGKRRFEESQDESTQPPLKRFRSEGATSYFLGKRNRDEEDEDYSTPPPLKRVRFEPPPAPQKQPSSILAAQEPNESNTLTASENVVLNLLKELLKDTESSSTTTTTTNNYKISLPTPNGILHFYHPFTLLHYLRFWDGYNQQSHPQDIILLPALSNELIEEILDHSIIRHPSKADESSIQELKDRLERHRDTSGDSDIYG